jgi:O-antigen/teichoic acid export membrane protein
LSIMHAVEIVQPLILIPYAAHVLSNTGFGQMVYAISIGAIAATIVDYGFHWTAQRAAASARDNPRALGRLLADVVLAKTLLLSIVTVCGIMACAPLLSITPSLFLCAMLTSIGNAFFPAWLYIGVERAWYAAGPVIAARLILLACFFFAVSSPENVKLATGIQASTPVLAALFSWPFLPSMSLARFSPLSLRGARQQLREGWRAFLFTAIERVAITLPVPLVAHFDSYVAAGQYSVAEKFVSGTRPFFRVISEVFLPRLAHHAKHSPADGMALLFKVFYTVIVGGALSITLFLLAPELVLLLFGSTFYPAIWLLRLMSIIPVLVNLNVLTSTLYMFNFGHERAWAYLTASSLFVFFFTIWFSSYLTRDVTTSVACGVIAKEAWVFVLSGGFFIRFGVARELREEPGRATLSQNDPSQHPARAT